MAGSVALACANDGAAVAWIAPTYKNSRTLWRFAEKMTAPVASRLRILRAEREIIFPATDGSLAIYSADAPDSILGNAFDLVILDEAARITGAAWTDAIQPTLADRAGRALLISTPKGHNWFWQEFVRARTQSDYACFTAPSSANPNPNIQRACAAARERVPERTYRQEWLAEFIEDGGGVFRHVRECATAAAQEKPIEGHVYVMGVDWARSNDYTVICVIDVNQQALMAMDRFSQIDYHTQLNRLVALYERFRPVAIYSEANSMGGPLTEDLQMQGLPVYRFDTTAQTKPVIIQALELAFERERIKIPDNETLIGELQTYEQQRMTSGIRYGAPEGGHDDCVMALAIGWHACGRMGSIF